MCPPGAAVSRGNGPYAPIAPAYVPPMPNPELQRGDPRFGADPWHIRRLGWGRGGADVLLGVTEPRFVLSTWPDADAPNRPHDERPPTYTLGRAQFAST